MRFFHFVIWTNLITIWFYTAAMSAEEEEIVLIKSVSNAKCVSSDCNLSVSTSGSGSTLSDGCTNTNGTCTGICERCQDSNPLGAAATHCENQKSTKDPCRVDPSSGGENFSCGTTLKYRCESSGQGPSSCCSSNQDGSQPQAGTGSCGTHVCFK